MEGRVYFHFSFQKYGEVKFSLTVFYITKGTQSCSNKAFWEINASIKQLIVYLISEFRSNLFMHTHWKGLLFGIVFQKSDLSSQLTEEASYSPHLIVLLKQNCMC